MPVISGFEFLEHLLGTDLAASVKQIAILSSSDKTEDKAKAKQLGIENYLVKPVSYETLTRLLL
jgi:CheY-like chemotaxis protein